MKPRIFIDSNILISGLIFQGLESDILKLAIRNKAHLVISETVLNEIKEVILGKFPNHFKEINEFIKIAGFEIIASSKYSNFDVNVEIRDIKDVHVLAAALSSNCDYLVTGDNDLLVVKITRIKILNSRQLLNEIS